MNSESRPSRKQAGTPGSDKTESRPDSALAAAFRGMDNSLTHAISSACKWLVEQQKPDGHWVGSVASNASMEAEWCLALWFLGLEDHPLRPRLGKALLEMQREDG